jgi:hypothetical protein
MNDDSAVPAHLMWVELKVRFSRQSMNSGSGDEENAVKSICSMFAVVGVLMRDYPNAAKFQQLAFCMLDTLIRPYTARWHSWMNEENRELYGGGSEIRYYGGLVRRELRQELEELNHKMLAYLEAFDALRNGLESDVILRRRREEE